MSGSLEKRFFRKRGPLLPSGCMEWLGSLDKRNYGRISSTGLAGDPKMFAHRVAYEIHFGKIPSGQCVCHRCDNPKCVNWEHLFLGTQLENIADMVSKDRQKRSKISEDDLTDIRMMRGHGMTMREIAAHYGVSRPLINLILGGKITRLSI